MARSGLLTLLLVIAVGAAVLVMRGADEPRALVDSLGVQNQEPVARLAADQTACQRDVAIVPDIRSVSWVVNTQGRPGPPLRFEIRAGRRVLARARLAAGYGDGVQTFALASPVSASGPVGLCVRNAGRTPIQLYGSDEDSTGPINVAAAGRYENSGSSLTVQGREVPGDAFVDFPAPRGATRLDEAPRYASRIAAWLPAPFGTWTVVALAAALLLAVTLGLGRALSAAARHDG